MTLLLIVFRSFASIVSPASFCSFQNLLMAEHSGKIVVPAGIATVWVGKVQVF